MKKSKPLALLPIAIFLILFLYIGISTSNFYAMPAIVGFLIALAFALFQNPPEAYPDGKFSFGAYWRAITKKGGLMHKISVAAKGAGEENIITMCFIFLLAGAFSGAISAAGGVDSTVHFFLTILPPNVAVVGIFVIGCFISVSMGTSVGTITALTPIAIGIAEKTGFPVAICAAAVVSGAMFGDNLSMISDTTIAAVRTQGCEMHDKFRQNFFVVLPAAIITMVILFVETSSGNYHVEGDLTYNLWLVLPYLLVLVSALIGCNVFLVLMGGTVVSVIAGVSLGTIAPENIFSSIGAGVNSMYDITAISLIVAAVIALVKENGGIDYILDLIKAKVRSRRGAELGIAGLASLLDICTANNTVAIVMAGPIAKDIAQEFDIPPKSSASILDIFTSVWQGILPYGAQVLTAATLVQASLTKAGSSEAFTSFSLLPHLYYPFLMGISALIYFAVLRRDREVKQ